MLVWRSYIYLLLGLISKMENDESFRSKQQKIYDNDCLIQKRYLTEIFLKPHVDGRIGPKIHFYSFNAFSSVFFQIFSLCFQFQAYYEPKAKCSVVI